VKVDDPPGSADRGWWGMTGSHMMIPHMRTDRAAGTTAEGGGWQEPALDEQAGGTPWQ